MSVNAITHLNFHGQAREALEFYGAVFAGQATIATYADFGMPKDRPGAERVVFGQVVADSGFAVAAYDVPAGHGISAPPAPTAPTTRRENGVTLTHEPFFVAVRGETVEEITALWEKLSEGATVVEPFGPAQWAPAFGMLTDKFGVTWVLDVAASHSGT